MPRPLASLDAHAHLDAASGSDFSPAGFVLSQTMSLTGAVLALERQDSKVCWGVGCHPRSAPAISAFSAGEFRRLIDKTPLVGEVGLDTGSRTPRAAQLSVFRAVLEAVAELPRIVSIHGFRATTEVLDELEGRPIVAPVLHWWTGRSDETRRAVSLGCYFSIHSAVESRSIFASHVPLERVLIESDQGALDPPAAIPLRVSWVEHLVAQRYRTEPERIRAVAWQNLARLAELTETAELFPTAFTAHLTMSGL